MTIRNTFVVTVIPRGRPASIVGWNSAYELERVAVNQWYKAMGAFVDLKLFDSAR